MSLLHRHVYSNSYNVSIITYLQAYDMLQHNKNILDKTVFRLIAMESNKCCTGLPGIIEIKIDLNLIIEYRVFMKKDDTGKTDTLEDIFNQSP